jgi:hypothetical protein
MYRPLPPTLRTVLCLVVLSVFSSSAYAQASRKTFVLPYDSTISRLANQRSIESKARQEFLREFLKERFAKQAINNLSQDIDRALAPADKYILSFQIIEASIVSDNSASVTVEGEIDLPDMVVALVKQNILSFGARPPKVVFLPANVQSPGAVEKLQALAFEYLQAAKLDLVDFRSLLSALASAAKSGNRVPDSELKRIASQYGADYYVIINSSADVRPYTDGGYISSSNFTYTLMRPGSGKVIGSGSVEERTGGSTPSIAYDKSVELLAPQLVSKAASQLYLSIFNNSSVTYSDSTIVDSGTAPTDNLIADNSTIKENKENKENAPDRSKVKKQPAKDTKNTKDITDKKRVGEKSEVKEDKVAENRVSKTNEAKITVNLKRLS